MQLSESLKPVIERLNSLRDNIYYHNYSSTFLIWSFGKHVFGISVKNDLFDVSLMLMPSKESGNHALIKKNITLSQLLHFTKFPKFTIPDHYVKTPKTIDIQHYLKINKQSIKYL